MTVRSPKTLSLDNREMKGSSEVALLIINTVLVVVSQLHVCRRPESRNLLADSVRHVMHHSDSSYCTCIKQKEQIIFMAYVIMNNTSNVYFSTRPTISVGKITARSLNPRFYYNVPDPDQD